MSEKRSLSRRVVAALWLAATAALAPTHAQQPPVADAVLASFREFRAALERGDAAEAEAAAARGLEASERVNGPRTAVLALNLATLRFDRGDAAGAFAPAARAYELALANEESGVDPVLAALTFGRIALATGDAQGGPRLRDAIAQAEAADAWHSDAYSGAVALARNSFAVADYPLARQDWAAAARLAASLDGAPVAQGVARTGEGAAIFMQAVNAGSRRPGVAGTLITAIDGAAAREASAAFAAALDSLRPITDAADGDDFTRAQLAYAEALAWDGALRSKMQAQGEELPRAPRRAPAVMERCPLRLVPEPAPRYPPDVLLDAGFGAVVVRVRTDAEGAVTNLRVAAAIPQGSFSDAVESVAGDWRVEVAPDAVPGCRRDGTHYTPILFVADAAPPPVENVFDEIIVTGRTPAALRLEVERAENAVFERFNAINSSDDFDVYCDLTTPTGSNIPRRVCAPVFLRKAQARAGADVLLSIQGSAFSAGSEQYHAAMAGDQYRRLEAEMRRLGAEDEQLLDALKRLVELRERARDAGSARRER